MAGDTAPDVAADALAEPDSVTQLRWPSGTPPTERAMVSASRQARAAPRGDQVLSRLRSAVFMQPRP